MKLTVSEFGLICVLVFFLLNWLGVLTTTRSVIAFFGAVIVVGVGVVGHAITAVADWIQHTFGTITAWAFGIALPAGVFIALAIIVAHDWHPKKSATKKTGYAALALGAIIAAGVAGIPALAGLRGLILHLAGQVVGVINQASGV